MNKRIMMVAALFAACAQAMENVDANAWSITVGSTKINLIKGFVGDAGNRVGVIVVGRNQQQALKGNGFGNIQEVGRCYVSKEHTVLKKNRDDESASDDDTYKPCRHVDDSGKDEATKIWERTTKVEVNADVAMIIEPRIMNIETFDSDFKPIEVSYYGTSSRKDLNKKSCEIEGLKAIREAREDLKLCYEKILSKVAEHVHDKEEKSIALQALSTEVGFPRAIAAEIAVKAVLECIKHNPGAYDIVELFVKKRFEFALYKELLEKSVTEK